MVTAPAAATHQSRAVGDFDAEESRIIEDMVRDYILNHPEVILKAVEWWYDYPEFGCHLGNVE